MRLLVCGPKYYPHREALFSTLDKLAPTLVIEGGGPGVEQMAREWAEARGVELHSWKVDAEWEGRYGAKVKHYAMLNSSKPDVVLAVGGGRMTANVAERAERFGIPVVYTS